MFEHLSLGQIEQKMLFRLHTLLPPDADYHRLTDLMALTMSCPGMKERCVKKFCEVLDLRMDRLHDVVKEIMDVKKAMGDSIPQ